LEKEFLQIISSHQGILHKVCRMYCDSPEDTEDLFQEMLLQLWRSFPAFGGRSAVSTWMYRVALNTAITRLRKESGTRQVLRFTPDAPDRPRSGTGHRGAGARAETVRGHCPTEQI
jgi:RNA polymerase sigma factor (sigma-70 family)